MESTPYCCFISGLMKRQPMVVSKISALREKASSALPCTNGARVIDSTPPAMAKSISPARTARAAVPTASSPEAHSRFSVTPGEQQCHARDVAVVLASLVGAAVIDLIELLPIDLRVARHQRLDRNCGEIVGTHLGEGAAIATDRCAGCVTDESFARAHHAASEWARLVRACKSRRTSSSRAVGTGVSTTLSAKATFQPVLPLICSRVTPGWMET